jgi:branched-chain amino acid transport system permease protein
LSAVYWQFWLGLLLVAIVVFARGGLMGGAIALHRRWLRSRT